ncbi:hypothetical protein [Variovorax sp. UMC13]|uniref:hypothetical protein n=1 Tax=Variovorax sp. UMC13 TaxID=1862326 RepID=UPI0016032EF4|nr:hypothetical protein [Variovorax sp. UMC13]
MTRAEAMRKLLALGELRSPDLLETCGWPRAEVQSVLDAEIEAGRITWVNNRRTRWYRVCSQNASHTPRAPRTNETNQRETVDAA